MALGAGAGASSYLTGNRVYNGGTNNPTSGTLNPSGYISRELRKKQSSRRSGLAATALRMQQKTPTTKSTPVVPPTPKNPTVTATPTGRLVLTEHPDTAHNVLPFDPQTAAQQVLLQKNQQDYLNSLTQQRQQLAGDVTTQERDLEAALPDSLRNVLNNYAGRGMAYSSGYGYQYGQTEADYARQRADLERQLQEGMAGFDADQQQATDDYQLALSQLMSSSAEGLSSDAGNLGLAPAIKDKAKKTIAKKKSSNSLIHGPGFATKVAKRIVKKHKKGGT